MATGLKPPWVITIGTALLLAVTGYFLARPAAPKQEELHFMHCPECELELPYQPGANGEPMRCPKCFDKGIAFVGTADSWKKRGRLVRAQDSIGPYLVFSFVAVLGVSYLVLVWAQRKARQKKVGPLFLFRCPDCRRKLRYEARKTGHAVMCPRCKKRLVLPVSASK